MKKVRLICCLFILLKFVLQYVLVNDVYELHRDEFLHLDQAKHLAWGFHSVPPVTSWISWIILQLGNGIFWVKFFPALFGALTILVVWKTIERLNGGLFACVLASTAILFSVLLRLNILYQPNSLEVLCWTLVYYSLISFVKTKQDKWLYFLAVSFAIGFLNKYNIVFCVLGLLPALLITAQRKIFFKPQFYLAVFFAFALISPNLIWQYQNDFPVFKHMKELAETQLVRVKTSAFIKEQVFFFIGSLFILIAGFISFFKVDEFKPHRFLCFAFAFTIGLFIYFKAKAYYAIGLYPIFFAFGSIYLEKLTVRRKKLRYVFVAIVSIFIYPLIEITMPIYTPEKYKQLANEKLPFSEHTWEDGKKHPISQDFADMLGWKELAKKVDSIYTGIADKEHTMILCDNYGQAGAINYYTTTKGLKADAFTDDYTKWVDLDREINVVIRIKTVENIHSSRDFALFDSIKMISKIEEPFAREKGTQLIVLSEPKLDLGKLLRQERAKGNLQ